MSEKKSKQFLKQLFWQAYLDENFYTTAKQNGVNFLTWPNTNDFKICKDFENLICEKNHSFAVFKLDLKIPNEVHQKIISENELKIFYQEYLLNLLALELSEQIKRDPKSAETFCDNFLNKKTFSKNIFSVAESVEKFIIENDNKIMSKAQNVVIKGFEILSNLISGFNVGRVSIITAHSGFGKSTLAINFLKQAMLSNLNSIFINMEMELFDITKRFLQSKYFMKQHEFEKNDYIKTMSTDNSWFEKSKTTYFTDGASLSMSEIKNLIRDAKKKQKIDLVLVDYDQKIINDVDRDFEEWKFIQKSVEGLEAIAKAEKIHIILFSQTDDDKAGMPRASKRAIQPASCVVYFHRDDTDQIILSFLKNRFGPINKKVLMNYDPATSSISEVKILEDIFQETKNSTFKRKSDAIR